MGFDFALTGMDSVKLHNMGPVSGAVLRSFSALRAYWKIIVNSTPALAWLGMVWFGLAMAWLGWPWPGLAWPAGWPWLG